MTRIIAVFALVLVICSAAAAQYPGLAVDEQKFTASTHYFYLLDGDARDLVGGGWGVDLGYKISSDGQNSTYLNVGYTMFSGSMSQIEGPTIDTDVTVIPVMINRYFKPAGSRFYYGAGAGLVRTKIEASSVDGSMDESDTDFAWQLVGGMNFNKTWFGELKYFDGSVDGNTGLSLSIGARF